MGDSGGVRVAHRSAPLVAKYREGQRGPSQHWHTDPCELLHLPFCPATDASQARRLGRGEEIWFCLWATWLCYPAPCHHHPHPLTQPLRALGFPLNPVPGDLGLARRVTRSS